MSERCADHWTHHDPAVRELIRAAQAEAWDEGAYVAYRAERDGYDGSELPNPYREAAR